MASPRSHFRTVALAVCMAACRGAHRDTTQPVSFAEEGTAQSEFRVLRAQFFDAEGPARSALTLRLGDFLQRFPDDPRALDVRTFLAFARIEANDRAGARAFVEPVLKSAEGPRRDFARVAEAAIFARSGEAPRAMRVLEALDGRLVDLDERFVYGEERARASVVAGAYDEALEALLAWLVQAPLDRQSRARTTAAALLDLVPTADLVRALATLRRETEAGTRPELQTARPFVSTTIARKLTELALARSDADLARRLLDAAPVALRATPEGQRLLALASAGTKAAVVAGRSVGLLLSLTDSLSRRRASAVAAGITRVLGSARALGGSGVDLVVRYDTNDVDAALGALAADGAGLFVAGNDDETARAASTRAEFLRIPLILLRPLQRAPKADGYSFVLGVDDDAVEQQLIQALDQRGRRELGRVGPGGTSCDVESEAPGRPRFPLATWKKGGVDALLVLGDVDCARDLAGEIKRNGGEALTLALGLDASFAYATLGVPTLTVAMGSYPASSPAGGWYEALGHDAALLAARALEALPPAGVTRSGGVEALHEKARDALAGVGAELWTSGERGFAGRRSLARELVVTAGGPNER